MGDNMNYFNSIDNIKIYYEVKGEGTTVILIHGFSANHDVFRVQQRVLSKDYKIITYDLRGHGLSNNLDGEITIEMLAYDLKELIDHLGLRDIVLVGWSLGGSILLKYLSLFGGHKISKICLIDTSPKVINDKEWKLGLYHGEYYLEDGIVDLNLIKANFEEFSHKFIRSMAPNLKEKHFEIAVNNMLNNDSNTMFQIWSSLLKMDIREDLSKINMETLLIFGGKSSLYSKQVGTYLNNHIKDSKLIVFEDNSHLVVQENPIGINRVLKKFIGL